jgi:hypothetical protein
MKTAEDAEDTEELWISGSGQISEIFHARLLRIFRVLCGFGLVEGLVTHVR